jgi:GNAT superfamily N-acetyltransferase
MHDTRVVTASRSTAGSEPPSGVAIERLRLDGQTLDDVARVATEAFSDDPFFCFLMPSERMRRRGLRIFFRSVVGTSRAVASVYGARGTDGSLVGVAAFVGPGGFPLPVTGQVRRLVSAVGALIPRPTALVDGARYLFATEKAHPHERMWYLQLLAVDPNCQRGGIGAALQGEVYPNVDDEGLDCYLETQKEDNLAYYRRFGYDVDAELHPVRSGPPLWTMRRRARHPGG